MGAGPPIFRKCNGINEFSKSLVVQWGLNNFLKFTRLRNACCVMGAFYGYLINLKGLSVMISGKNIHKKYGAVEVLKGVDIDIRKGEVASIVGPSGSGKSTLLHILGTLDKADTGTVSMNDTAVHSLTGKRLAAFRNKHIGFVFQFHHLLPEFNAWENVCIPG